MFLRRVFLGFFWLHKARGCHGNRTGRAPPAASRAAHPSGIRALRAGPRTKVPAKINRSNKHNEPPKSTKRRERQGGTAERRRGNNCFIVEPQRGIAEPSSTYSPLCKADSSPAFPPLPAPELVYFIISNILISVFSTIICTAQAICISISAEPPHSQSYSIVPVLLRLVYFFVF